MDVDTAGLIRPILIGGYWSPEPNVFCRELKSLRHDSDDQKILSVHLQGLTQHVRGCSKPSLPQGIAEDNNALLPCFFFLRKPPAQHWGNPQDLQQVGGSIGSLHTLRLFSGEGHPRPAAIAIKHSQAVERPVC